jgi:gluconate 2-dehydrogenase gamma chain
MTESGIDRRNFVAALGGVAASAWVAVNPETLHAAAAYAAQAAAQARYQVLTAAQVRELDAVTSTIVPTDTTPGARETRVVRFIDRSLATWAADQKPQMTDALKALGDFVAAQRNGNRSFAAIPAAERTKVLEAFEQAHGREFNGGFWFPTMSGMFSNPSYGGNFNKVGWSLMGFRDQFSWATPFGYYDRV